MKRFVMALALACTLSGAALAGETHSTDSPAPTPPPAADTAVMRDVPITDSALTGDAQTCGLIAVLTVLDLVF